MHSVEVRWEDDVVWKEGRDRGQRGCIRGRGGDGRGRGGDGAAEEANATTASSTSFLKDNFKAWYTV